MAGCASSTALTTSFPVTPGIGVVPDAKMSVMHHQVGVDERVAVCRRHDRHAIEPIGLEDGDDPPPAVAAAPRRGQHRADLARQVGVVVDQRGAAVDSTDVEPAGDPAELGQGTRGDLEINPDRARHRQRAERVAHVVDAAQRQVDRAERAHRNERR